MSASLVFEQSYSGVDGDSASSTELYALLSAISTVPIKQSLAVIGSVNQHGEVQAIGARPPIRYRIVPRTDAAWLRQLTHQEDAGILIIPATDVSDRGFKEVLSGLECPILVMR